MGLPPSLPPFADPFLSIWRISHSALVSLSGIRICYPAMLSVRNSISRPLAKAGLGVWTRMQAVSFRGENSAKCEVRSFDRWLI